MSKHNFDPNCPDCRPVILDPATGKAMPPDHPVMKAMMTVWDSSPREDQEAFHRITVLSQMAPADLARMQAMMERVKALVAS